jgi:hypothetical protein
MALNDPNGKFILVLNNETFQENLFGLQKPDCHAAMESLKKLPLPIWSQLYAAK